MQRFPFWRDVIFAFERCNFLPIYKCNISPIWEMQFSLIWEMPVFAYLRAAIFFLFRSAIFRLFTYLRSATFSLLGDTIFPFWRDAIFAYLRDASLCLFKRYNFSPIWEVQLLQFFTFLRSATFSFFGAIFFLFEKGNFLQPFCPQDYIFRVQSMGSRANSRLIILLECSDLHVRCWCPKKHARKKSVSVLGICVKVWRSWKRLHSHFIDCT